MPLLLSFYYLLLKFPIKLLVKCKVIPDTFSDQVEENAAEPIFYVIKYDSSSDLLALAQACKKLALPDPLKPVVLNNKRFSRVLFLQKTSSVLPWKQQKQTQAIPQGLNILSVHEVNNALDAQLIPVNITWGRTPTKENKNGNVSTVIADEESPTWLRKIFIVLFAGRNTLARFSEPVSFKYIKEKHGTNEPAAHKLMRIARFHFYRQTVALTGPRLMDRKQMFTALFAKPAIKKIITDEAQSKNLSETDIKKQALVMMQEIAGDYRESMINLGDRVLKWLWKRLYTSIEVNNASTVRALAQEGHEIIYLPCHRSHMDYLLLTYIIAQEGLVTPRIAAGINLNFWPAGSIFRKAGAFFIRRSFNGNRLYSTVFKEYLGLLFERGYSVKYYCEGGRSRTGRLLPAKTGMLAMTIQSLLRGIDRPLTIVPVYIGYEHVMEVGSYHKELSGNKKKKESFLGVFKAIKSLRNYGKGYINFGDPINLNTFLTDQAPLWKEDINQTGSKKPQWLTPTVNKLADNVMTKINQCAALNGVSLIALILHATRNKALSKIELVSQLDFFLALQRAAPYSEQLTLPNETGAELLADVISLNKVTVNEDSFGTIISLDETASLEMRYYRNNILHTYILHSLVCRVLACNWLATTSTIVNHVAQLLHIIKSELFIWGTQQDMESSIKASLKALATLNIAQQTNKGTWMLLQGNSERFKSNILAECIDETIQRLAIICSLIDRLSPISQSDFEEKVVSIAKRLSVLNHINAPEFTDKKAQSLLINTMQKLGYITVDNESALLPSNPLTQLKDNVLNLTGIEVLQSISR